MRECYANIKCYLKEEETTRDADYGKMPGTHPAPLSLHPEAKGLLKPSAGVPYPTLLGCSLSLCACTHLHTCARLACAHVTSSSC